MRKRRAEHRPGIPRRRRRVARRGSIAFRRSLASRTSERVANFYACKRVTKLESGKEMSQRSIDRTRRVLRLALVWAAERGIISQTPPLERPERSDPTRSEATQQGGPVCQEADRPSG
jgi:hypothetical protein